MSDKRVKFALSGTLATIVMVVGLFSFAPIVSGVQSDFVSPDSSALGVFGHATITVLDTDGFVKSYAQTDNAVVENTKECMIDVFSTTAAQGTCGTASSLQLGSDASVPTETSTGLGQAYAGTNTNESGFAETRAAFGTESTLFESSFVFSAADTVATNGLGCIADTNTNGLPECNINEVILLAGAIVIAHAAVSNGPVTAEAGDTVEVDYTISVA